MAELEIVHQDATLRIVTTRNMHVNVWSSAPTLAQMHAFARNGTALARLHPRGTGLLNLILGGNPSFSEPVRAEVVRMMKLPALFSLGAAHIIFARGFAGTAARAFMSTTILISNPSRPNKVFGDPEAAAAWLAPLLARGAEPWSAPQIVALAAQVARA